MPPKQAGGKLGGLVPTESELEQARALLKNADKKAVKSKMASMSHWLADNPDAEVSGSRGAARKECLEKFLVFQLRQKASVKTTETQHKVSQEEGKHSELRLSQTSFTSSPSQT